VSDAELAGMIVEIHQRSRRTYGAPRVHAELARLGRRCGRKRVARLMRSQQLVGVHARRRWRRGRPDTAAAPDLVQRNFNPTGPDRLWAADVTQFHTGEGWLHLAAVIDLWSRRVVGWAMGPTANADHDPNSSTPSDGFVPARSRHAAPSTANKAWDEATGTLTCAEPRSPTMRRASVRIVPPRSELEESARSRSACRRDRPTRPTADLVARCPGRHVRRVNQDKCTDQPTGQVA
jgi:HTH-like domain